MHYVKSNCVQTKKKLFFTNCSHDAVRQISNKQLGIDLTLKSAENWGFFPSRYLAFEATWEGLEGKFSRFIQESGVRWKICWCFLSLFLLHTTNDWGYSCCRLISHPLIDVREHVFHLRMAQDSAAYIFYYVYTQFLCRATNTPNKNQSWVRFKVNKEKNILW
jgi:hypothetical protein